jgi:hypothetical protein
MRDVDIDFEDNGNNTSGSRKNSAKNEPSDTEL